MHSRFLLRAAAALCCACLPFAAAAQSLVRVACDDDAAGAAITVNGEFKGDCPLDLQVAPGSVKVEALKSLGNGRQRVFTSNFAIGNGVAKRVEVELGPVQLTAEGRRLEEERQRRERAAAEAREAEQRRVAAAQRATARAAVDGRVNGMLAAERARSGPGTPDCPDCPKALPGQSSLQVSTELPDTGDETTRALARRALQTLLPFLTRPDSLAPPAQAAALPCAQAEAQMRELAGMRDLSEQPGREQDSYKNATKALAADYYYQGVRIWPVQASCADGKLDGDLDFWIFGNHVLDTAQSITVQSRLVHVTTRFAAGKRVGVSLRVSHMRGGLSYFKDANTRKMMESLPNDNRFDFVEADYRQEGGEGNGFDAQGANVSHMFFANPDVQKAMEGLNVSVTRPLGGGRSEVVTWSGMRRASRTLMKNGQLHGEMVSYGYSKPVGFLLPDLKIPTTTFCYREGVQVQMNPCNVN